MTKTTRLRKALTIALALTAAVALASCSTTSPVSSSTPSASPEPTSSVTPSRTSSATPSRTSSSSPTRPAGRRVDITVKGKAITPRPRSIRLAVGESLTIAVTSDHNGTLHAHGFGIQKSVKAGQRLEFTIKGAKQGIFEVELHDPKLRILQIAVR